MARRPGRNEIGVRVGKSFDLDMKDGAFSSRVTDAPAASAATRGVQY